MTAKTAVKTRPIIFSGEMVRAILDGKKTQTRRVIKPQPEYVLGGRHLVRLEDMPEQLKPSVIKNLLSDCPYGQPGDRLWVRETWARVPTTAYRCSEGVQQTCYPDDPSMAVVYRAGWERSDPGVWKSPYHMYRWMSRITLELTGVRVERLHDISEADIKAEGFDRAWYRGYTSRKIDEDDDFSDFWDHVNGKRAPWSSNPWVWVMEFTVVQPC